MTENTKAIVDKPGGEQHGSPATPVGSSQPFDNGSTATEVIGQPGSPKTASARKSWFSRTMEGLIVAFTAVNIGVAYYQWRAMRESNDLAVAALEGDQRARLAQYSSQIGKIEPGEPIPVTLRFTNTGKGTAEAVIFMAASFISGSLVDMSNIDYDYFRNHRMNPDTGVSTGRIPTDRHHDYSFNVDSLTQEDVDDITEGRRHLYIHGRAVYSDDFCAERILRFCGYYKPPDTITYCWGGSFEPPCNRRYSPGERRGKERESHKLHVQN